MVEIPQKQFSTMQMVPGAINEANLYGEIGALHKDAGPMVDRLQQGTMNANPTRMGNPLNMGMFAQLMGGMGGAQKPASPNPGFQPGMGFGGVAANQPQPLPMAPRMGGNVIPGIFGGGY